MARPILAAAKSQQKQINKMELQLAFLARLAGVTPEFDEISKQADALNPGQPVDDPASQGASESTEQTRTPEAYDNAQNPGETGGSVQKLPADTTDVALNPGQSLPTAPFGNLQEVTAPVAGTETHIPNDQTRIETDVRVGNPMAPDVAFPWTIGGTASNRTLASLHLARLRLSAGLEQGDDIVVSASIEASNISDHDLVKEIEVLSAVQKAASRRSNSRPANLVPRAASVQRTVPSLQSESLVSTAGLGSPDDASDLFD